MKTVFEPAVSNLHYKKIKSKVRLQKKQKRLPQINIDNVKTCRKAPLGILKERALKDPKEPQNKKLLQRNKKLNSNVTEGGFSVTK